MLRWPAFFTASTYGKIPPAKLSKPEDYVLQDMFNVWKMSQLSNCYSGSHHIDSVTKDIQCPRKAFPDVLTEDTGLEPDKLRLLMSDRDRWREALTANSFQI